MVLTLFETHSFEEMGFFLNLMAHLSEHSIPCAHTVSDREQNYLRMFKNKPAALVERLNGASLYHPVDLRCTVLGTILAQLHIA